MRTVTVEARSTAGAAAAFAVISRFESFPAAERAGLAAEVLWESGPSRRPDLAPVSVQPGPPRTSRWGLRFGDGMIRWEQRDECSPQQMTIRFEQTAGDFACWRGRWQVSAIPAGCHVRFEASYDVGVPMFGPLVERCAGQVVTRSVTAVLTGLFPRIRGLCTPAADCDPETYVWSLFAAPAVNRS
jgi:hypothetical protein